MIPLTRGFKRSISAHNIELDVLSDWMEASVLFADRSELPVSEIVDFLIQEEIYEEQSFCWARIDEGLGELRRRTKSGPAFPIRIVERRIERLVGAWQDVPAHSFLLLLTLAQRYDKWADVMPIDYNFQGELFEELTTESLKGQFPDWVIHRTGWTRAHPTKLSELVTEIAGRLGELQGEVSAWTDPEAKEAGLDLLCYRPFPDGFVGVPLLLLQCASGNWKEPGKLKTPDIDVWNKIITFASEPKRAFATHFSFLKDDFRKIAGKVDGVLLDRYRIVAYKDEHDWVSPQLMEKLKEWVEARVVKLLDLGS